MVKYRGELSKMGQAGPLIQAVVGGLQVQTHKLLEPLMKSPVVNKTSVKLGILCERRRRHLESHKVRLKMAETCLNILEVRLEELYQYH
ncbi:hypothetical protein B296_00021478 [Ensete ventricosum]|uniref:Uncharacterized protein n=1 Tax=Ensete ventricosum TaxID=4639 RepID=A0A426XDI9_ENSVE|nr:hypothetical protein B296_00021478 [Ensete ventricosum]